MYIDEHFARYQLNVKILHSEFSFQSYKKTMPIFKIIVLSIYEILINLLLINLLRFQIKTTEECNITVFI